MTDTICHLLTKYGICSQTSSLERAAFRFSEYKPAILSVYQVIVRQWAVIFSIISETDFANLLSLMGHYMSTSSVIFEYFRFARLDLNVDFVSQFLTNVTKILKESFKKKQLNLDMLVAAAKMASMTPAGFQPELQTLFEFAWSVKEIKNLKEGAFELITSIFPRLPQEHTRAAQFYKQHVYPHANEPRKLSRSIRLFHRRIMGLELDPLWYAWEWGVQPRVSRYFFIRWCSETSQKISSTFLRYFFDVSIMDSSIKTQYFDLLLHIASLDFNRFLNRILPKFLEFNIKDDRLLVLLKTVSVINSSDFIDNAFLKVNPNSLQAFNQMVKSKVMNYISCFDGAEEGIEKNYEHTRQIQEADITITARFKTQRFIHDKMKYKENSHNEFIPAIVIASCLAATFTKEDAENHMKMVIAMAANRNRTIGTAGLEICKKHLLDNAQFQEMVISELLRPINIEREYTLLSILEMMPNVNGPQVEIAALIGMSLINPQIRLLAFRLVSRLSFNNIFRLHTKTMENAIGFSFHTTMASHCYHMWLQFISEIGNMIVAIGNKPLLDQMRLILLSYLKKLEQGNPVKMGIAILLLASHAHFDGLLVRPAIYGDEPDRSASDPDTRVAACAIVRQMLTTDPDSAFKVISLAHFTLFPILIAMLFSVPPKQIPDAIHTIDQMLQSPSLNPTLIRNLFPQISIFIAILSGYFIHNGLSSYTLAKLNEPSLYAQMSTLQQYCNIIRLALPTSIISEDLWPVSKRDTIFRFIMNWACTKSDKLLPLRRSATKALEALIRVGPIVDNLKQFGQAELVHIPNPGLFIFHQPELVPVYVEGCIRQPAEMADNLFESLMNIFDADLRDYAGSLILVSTIFTNREHPTASVFAEQLHENLKKPFRYFAESIIADGLSFIQKKKHAVSNREIVDAIRPWVKLVRLLPNQNCCISSTKTQNAIFTPFGFMSALKNTTVKIGNSDFNSVAIIWADLLKSPDHYSIIPSYICEWSEQSVKIRLMEYLYSSAPEIILQRIVQHCSFAYYCYINSLGWKFDNEIWITNILKKALDIQSIDGLPAIAHFATLFDKSLLSAIARHLNVEIDKIKTAINCEQWATEAMRWVIGCNDTKLATISLKVYNSLGVKADSLGINGVCKAVTFHLKNNDQPVELVHHAFEFFTQNYTGNESIALAFGRAFLRCFQFSSWASVHLFEKILNNGDCWKELMWIVRPLAPVLETDVEAQRFIDIVGRRTKSGELMAMVEPVRMVRPDLWEWVKPLDELRPVDFQSTLLYYSEMFPNASEGLREAVFSCALWIISKTKSRDGMRQLYQAALELVNLSEGSIKLISAIKEIDLVENVSDERKVEDVLRDLSKIYPRSDSLIRLTDCSHLESVYAMETDAKIMPFSAERELIEGMRKISIGKKRMKASPSKRSSRSICEESEIVATKWKVVAEPFDEPQQIADEEIVMQNYDVDFVMTIEEFINLDQ